MIAPFGAKTAPKVVINFGILLVWYPQMLSVVVIFPDNFTFGTSLCGLGIFPRRFRENPFVVKHIVANFASVKKNKM